jgi:hypothetical protein
MGGTSQSPPLSHILMRRSNCFLQRSTFALPQNCLRLFREEQRREPCSRTIDTRMNTYGVAGDNR